MATETAEQLFDRARQLLKDQHYAEACATFARSFEVGRLIGAELNLGDCAQRDGHLAVAWRLFDAAARDWARQGDDDRAAVARKKADQVATQLATVVVTLAEPVTAGTTLTIAGRAVPPAHEVRQLVEPTDVEVVVTRPGHPPIRRTAHAHLGAVAPIDMGAPAPSMTPIAAPPRDTAPIEHERSQVVSLVLAGGALVLGGTAVGVWRLSASTDQQSQHELDDTRQRLVHDLANRQYYVAQGLGIASVTCASVAIWLYLHNRGERQAATAMRPQLTVAPVIASDRVGLLFEGRY